MRNIVKLHDTAPRPFKERIIDALTRKWKTATLIIGLMAAVMVTVLIMDNIQENRRGRSAMLAEDIQELFVEWEQLDAEDRDDETITALIEEALTEYPGDFAAQRALFTRGLMALDNEEWRSAADDFQELADRRPKSYLAPVSLFNAGSALEEAGDMEAAKAAWTRLVDQYAEISPDAPEALFNLGRLAESEGDMEAAFERYREIGSRFPRSRWKDLAKSRILKLET